MNLEEILNRYAEKGELYTKLPDKKVKCYACAHTCLIPEGKRGICKVRFNNNGELFVPFNYVGGINCDPIEKKPFFHAYPGALALSFGMFGCNFYCNFCQNWVTSQAMIEPTAGCSPMPITPDEVITLAIKYNSKIIASTYNEPLITSEWAKRIFTLAKEKGIATAYVSNGHATREVLDYLKDCLDMYKVDLKTFRDKNYRQVGGVLKHVLNTITMLVEKGLWVEVVTLIIPDFNDSDEELADIAKFLYSVSPDIPWHVTSFHPAYKMSDIRDTTYDTLLKAVEIGYRAGLHFVYAGNLPGMVKNYEDTSCYGCKTTLIKRVGFRVIQNTIKDGKCSNCGKQIPGRW